MISLACQITARKDNNFNLLRLLLAMLVIFSHSYPVALGPGGDTRAEPLNLWTCRQASSGAIALNSFFFVSGFLIAGSWLRSRGAVDYLRKRILRIYPGFISALGLTAAMIWALCPEFRATVVHPMDWFRQLLHDGLLLGMGSISQPGVFFHNPFSYLANASLWTIPFEFLCYLAVLVLGVLGLVKRRWLILVAAVLGYGIYGRHMFQANDELPQFLMCFATGATVWLWQDKILFSRKIALGCLLGILCASEFPPWFSFLFPVLGGYSLLWLAYAPKLKFSVWADKTDLSYGTYLYAFPVQQFLAMNPAFRNPWLIFVLATPLTLVLAWLSWNGVERRCLALKKLSSKVSS